MPRSADLAVFFWWRVADLVRTPKSTLPRRFGLIASNSIRQTFCRRVIAEALGGPRRLHLVFAIPDHPWADGAGDEGEPLAPEGLGQIQKRRTIRHA